jgi:hypothetical protein
MLLSFICQIIEFSPDIEGLGLEISLVLEKFKSSNFGNSASVLFLVSALLEQIKLTPRDY